jgi:thiamine phosphate synthase YjbQ (UPF0047 family)
MPGAPVEVTLELTPRARFDVIDVRQHALAVHGPTLEVYPRTLHCSFHTTAGFLEQSLASRLSQRPQGIAPYIELFRTMFPEGAGYRHDEMELRTELTRAQRRVEPRNGDSHLAFMAAGLRTCVAYRNHRPMPVWFVDLDGMNAGTPRRRKTSVLGYNQEVEVGRRRIAVAVSGHPVDSINLKDPRLGIYEQLADLVAQHGVSKGRIRVDLAPGEREAGLTVNEYETLLMRHDLAEVLRDPLRFMTEKARHVLADPRAVPMKTLGYAKYDLVRTFNQLVDALGLGASRVERLIARAIGVPASRFLGMKRSVSLLVSDRQSTGRGEIVEGTYQSPILVQWREPARQVRQLDVILTRFV